jgi:hypothetical protein
LGGKLFGDAKISFFFGFELVERFAGFEEGKGGPARLFFLNYFFYVFFVVGRICPCVHPGCLSALRSSPFLLMRFLLI